jgi:flagellar biogenesis protein FliO
MSGAITRILAAALLAAGAVFGPSVAALAAEAPVPAAGAGPAAPAAASSEPLNLYEDGGQVGAPERRPAQAKASALSMVAKVGFWLGLVIALICGAVTLARKLLPRSAAWGGCQTAELVGRTFLESKRSVYLLKVGNRVLVIGSAENGLSALGEITDRAEVDYLACLARGRLAAEPGRRSEFSQRLGRRLSRLVGLTREGDEQIVEEDEALAAGATAAEAEETEAVGATAAADGLESLKEQLARLKRIS